MEEEPNLGWKITSVPPFEHKCNLPPASQYRLGTTIQCTHPECGKEYKLSDNQMDGKYWFEFTSENVFNNSYIRD